MTTLFEPFPAGRVSLAPVIIGNDVSRPLIPVLGRDGHPGEGFRMPGTGETVLGVRFVTTSTNGE